MLDLLSPVVGLLAHVSTWVVEVQVLRGYVGDRNAKPVFKGQTPFDVLGPGYQRPFELATLRLSNMIGILPKCVGKLLATDCLLTLSCAADCAHLFAGACCKCLELLALRMRREGAVPRTDRSADTTGGVSCLQGKGNHLQTQRQRDPKVHGL